MLSNTNCISSTRELAFRLFTQKEGYLDIYARGCGVECRQKICLERFNLISHVYKQHLDQIVAIQSEAQTSSSIPSF